MSGILLSDDAKSWFESGRCKNIEIKNNVFEYCGQAPVLIKPENSRHRGAVHKNIEISGNEFKNYSGFCIIAKSAENIKISNNRFNSGKIIRQKNCKGIAID